MPPPVSAFLLALAASTIPSTVLAQEVTTSWPGLDTPELTTVYVLDDAATETEGCAGGESSANPDVEVR